MPVITVTVQSNFMVSDERLVEYTQLVSERNKLVRHNEKQGPKVEQEREKVRELQKQLTDAETSLRIEQHIQQGIERDLRKANEALMFLVSDHVDEATADVWCNDAPSWYISDPAWPEIEEMDLPF